MPDGHRVLIVEDDPDVQQMLVDYLGGHGYAVRTASDGAAMRAALEAEPVDLVLLDVRLPGEDGLSLARHLRERHNVAIIMVTGASDVVDRVVGLEIGADDYVAKPFDPRELLARIRSVLRRAQAGSAGVSAAGVSSAPAPLEAVSATTAAATPAGPAGAARVRVGCCWFDEPSRRLWNDAGDEVALTAMEFELLRVFVANPNRVLSRDQLLQHTRHREWEPYDRSIDIRIGRLRRKVEAGSGEPRTIRTVRNGGYMFVPD